MFGLSFWEIALILVVALVVLGPKRLPDAARTLGRGLRSLRRASSDIRNAIEEPLREVREPLQEMRDDLYEAVNRFSDDVVESVRDVGAEAKELPEEEIGGQQAPRLAAGDEAALEEGAEAAAGEELEAEDGRRVAATDPFGSSDADDGARGAALLAVGPEPEVFPPDAADGEKEPRGGGEAGA